MLTCLYCGEKDTPEDKTRCIHCGAPIKKPEAKAGLLPEIKVEPLSEIKPQVYNSFYPDSLYKNDSVANALDDTMDWFLNLAIIKFERKIGIPVNEWIKGEWLKKKFQEWGR